MSARPLKSDQVNYLIWRYVFCSSHRTTGSLVAEGLCRLVGSPAAMANPESTGLGGDATIGFRDRDHSMLTRALFCCNPGIFKNQVSRRPLCVAICSGLISVLLGRQGTDSCQTQVMHKPRPDCSGIGAEPTPRDCLSRSTFAPMPWSICCRKGFDTMNWRLPSTRLVFHRPCRASVILFFVLVPWRISRSRGTSGPNRAGAERPTQIAILLFRPRLGNGFAPANRWGRRQCRRRTQTPDRRRGSDTGPVGEAQPSQQCGGGRRSRQGRRRERGTRRSQFPD